MGGGGATYLRTTNNAILGLRIIEEWTHMYRSVYTIYFCIPISNPMTHFPKMLNSISCLMKSEIVLLQLRSARLATKAMLMASLLSVFNTDDQKIIVFSLKMNLFNVRVYITALDMLPKINIIWL